MCVWDACRGLVQIQPTARGARNYSQCDSMLIGDQAGANTYPYIQVRPWALGTGQPQVKVTDHPTHTCMSHLTRTHYTSHMFGMLV